MYFILLTGKSEEYEFYQPLKNRLADCKSLIDNKLTHVAELVEKCQEKYGKSSQEKERKRKTAKNQKKEDRKRLHAEAVTIE